MLQITRIPELVHSPIHGARLARPGHRFDGKRLRQANLAFERSAGMQQDQLGISNSPSSTQVTSLEEPRRGGESPTPLTPLLACLIALRRFRPRPPPPPS